MASLDELLAMSAAPPHPVQRLQLNCGLLDVAAPLEMPPWLTIWGEDCAEHVHDHACW
jgi:hypothetical protein